MKIFANFVFNLLKPITNPITKFSVSLVRSTSNHDVVNIRRILHDDGRGVGEPLDETVCVDNKCDGLMVYLH